uniref:RGS domain-containing protein n=1 Tax=Hydatigena taeniaeformis TaxID=6205 RepID=A0A0R3WVH9_HYDTA
LACLYALQSGVRRILFGGFFIRGHRLTMEARALKAMFLRHEGYLGAVGAFMKASQPPAISQNNGVEVGEASAVQSLTHQAPQNQQQHSSKCWSESYATSLTSRSTTFSSPNTDGLTLSDFEFEHLGDMSLEPFPLLLSPADYAPDTWDLTQDCKARAYWLECFKQGVERLRKKAEESQAEKSTARDSKERAQLFANRYVNFLTELSVRPSGRGLLTVRSILEAQQHLLREFGFPDAFCVQKKFTTSDSLITFKGPFEYTTDPESK